MAIRMKIPRSNIYLRSGSLFFTKDSFQVSLYTVRTRYRDCIIFAVRVDFFLVFSRNQSTIVSRSYRSIQEYVYFFSFPPSETEDSMRTRVDVNARSRGPAFSALESRRLPAIYPSTSMEKGLLSAVVDSNSTLKDSSRTAVCIPRFFSYAIVRPASRRTAPWNRRHACKNHRYDNDREDIVKFPIA